jgi:hypothetical protein
MYPIFNDSEKNIVVYCDDENLVIENYLSKKRKIVKDNLLLGPYSGYNIDSIFFEDENLVVKIRNGNKRLMKKMRIDSLKKFVNR